MNVAKAARLHALWCDAVVRAHGVPTATDESAWRAHRRPPALYPDAVSLRPDVGEAVLDGVDTSPGCGVMDAFFDLDLEPVGFHVLFDATWYATTGGGVTEWRATQDLASWERAWGGPAGTFVPALSDEDGVTFLEGEGGGIVVHRTDEGATLSNAWGDVVRGWREGVAWAGAGVGVCAFGPLVPPGWREVGRLRIWARS
ncbi:MAG TPA: hypothetical protein VM345_14040 [Acidimicrobiales bacterium]|nr:hypothetical protein [Acidimicrobiales bacterium]